MELLVLSLIIGIFLELIMVYCDYRIKQIFKKYDLEMNSLRFKINMLEQELHEMGSDLLEFQHIYYSHNENENT